MWFIYHEPEIKKARSLSAEASENKASSSSPQKCVYCPLETPNASASKHDNLVSHYVTGMYEH